MKKMIITLALVIVSFSALGKNPIVIMKTNKGNIEIELYEKKAPVSVKNFLSYVDKKFYDGTVFHRVINNFMIQGGGYTKALKKKTTMAPIKNEASNKLENAVGTIAMARTSDINSATAQFFINVKDNPFLNYKGPAQGQFGYAVFGRVVKGMPVVNKIKMTAIEAKGQFRNYPVDEITILKITRKENK